MLGFVLDMAAEDDGDENTEGKPLCAYLQSEKANYDDAAWML